jgi:hypothetical protein
MTSLVIKKGEVLVRKILFTVVVAGISALSCHGQDQDSVKNLKNTVRINISNPLLFGYKFNVIGYERVIKDYQTASINIGRAGYPNFTFLSDSLDLKNQQSDAGFNLSLDYRFYLQKENKYRAPRGIYIGPYYSYNSFSRDLTWDLNNGEEQVGTGFDMRAHFVGVQLGYQFVFWKRLSVDMVLMGPGWWHFNLKSYFDTNLSTGDEQMLIEILNELLQENFPGSDFIIGGDGFDVSKNSSSDVAGFRYMINIGFRF